MKLIFVYNADSDLLSQTKDFVKKVLDPDSYACNLCRITYGRAMMKQEWKDFIKKSDIDMEFLHRDEFHDSYPDLKDEKLPAVFVKDNNVIRVVISADEINKISSIEELKKRVESINN